MDNQYPYPQQSAAPAMQSGNVYGDSRQIPQSLNASQPASSQAAIHYAYSNHQPSQQQYGWPNTMGISWQPSASVLPSTTQSISMPMGALVSPSGSSMVGMSGGASTPARPKLTTTLWEDEGTLCYQVDARGICVARRQDNDMINGTKLLNVVGMSRGKRDGILKNEKGRVVVKVGAMHLKGVWITFQRAKALASQFKILELLYPLFVEDPSVYLYTSPGAGGSTSARLPVPSYSSALPSPYRPHPNLSSFSGPWDARSASQQNPSTAMHQRYPSASGISASSSLQGLLSHDHTTSHSPPNAGLRHSAVPPAAQSEEDMYLLNHPFDGEDVYVQQSASAVSEQSIGVPRPRNPFPTPVSMSPASSPSPSMMNAGAGQQTGSYSPQQRPGRVPSPRHHPYGTPLQRSSSYTGSSSYNIGGASNIFAYGQSIGTAAYGDRTSSTERDTAQGGPRPAPW